MSNSRKKVAPSGPNENLIWCSKGHWANREDFHKHKTYANGLQPYCKTHQNECVRKSREAVENKKEKRKLYSMTKAYLKVFGG